MHSRIASAAAIGVIIMLPSAAFADVAEEISTTADHAGYAAASLNNDAVRMHLHHVVNCLEGPSGKDFDNGNENPCETLGMGAIPDETDVSTKAKLQSVLTIAKTGIASDDEATAKKAATDAYAALMAIK